MNRAIDEFEKLYGAGGIASPGRVVDTTHVPTIVYEIRWTFDVAPETLHFTPLGTNDAALVPDIPIAFDVRHTNLRIDADGKIADASQQETGRGFLVLKDMPRFVAVATYASGTFKTSDITLRAYGWGR